MDAMTTSFGEVLLWSFWFFIWIAAVTVWFRCIFDMFRDHTLSGWGKAGWAVLLIFVPWLGALIYIIARGRSMTERQMAGIGQREAAEATYIKQVAAHSTGAADQIGRAEALLDSGAISPSSRSHRQTPASRAGTRNPIMRPWPQTARLLRSAHRTLRRNACQKRGSNPRLTFGR